MIFSNLEFDDGQKEHLRRLCAPDTVYFGDPEHPSVADREAFLAADIAFGGCPPEWIPEAKKLRWMQFASVGVGEYAHLDWKRRSENLVCTNLRGFFAVPVAETAMAGLLSLYRGIDRLVELKPRRTWMKLELRMRLKTLSGANVLLVGYGSLGQRMRNLMIPFGCKVTAYDKFAEGAEWTELAELDTALPDADVICVALPDTPDTRRLFAKERLGLIKQGAVFINVGRGSVVDEDLLVEALSSGRLGGAVLDVTEKEPLPVEHPLWDCPNTVITQHTAGGSSDELDRKSSFFTDNLRRHRAGLPLENVVDWERGF